MIHGIAHIELVISCGVVESHTYHIHIGIVDTRLVSVCSMLYHYKYSGTCVKSLYLQGQLYA